MCRSLRQSFSSLERRGHSPILKTVYDLIFGYDPEAQLRITALSRGRNFLQRPSKASYEFAVPLCRTHHRAAHRAGDERAWWKASGIDPIKAARKLWKQTRLSEGRVGPERSPFSRLQTMPTVLTQAAFVLGKQVDNRQKRSPRRNGAQGMGHIVAGGHSHVLNFHGYAGKQISAIG
jgi:hypothetical protein